MAREIALDLLRSAEGDQEARRVIQSAGGLDATACEVAGLAHDLGHPPFGHSGEIVLNRLLRKDGVQDGFEGNAQSFRIVARLDSRRVESVGRGLNLTRLSLAAIAKYPWLCPEEAREENDRHGTYRREPPKFSFYLEDEEAFKDIKRLMPLASRGHRQTLEAAVMDLADDITYAFHDVEDAYLDGLIDFPQVSRDLEAAAQATLAGSWRKRAADSGNAFNYIGAKLAEKYAGYFDQQTYHAALTSVSALLADSGMSERFDGSPLKHAAVTDGLSKALGDIFGAISLCKHQVYKDGPNVVVEAAAWHRIQVLKTIARRYLVESARIGVLERGQREVIASLYRGLTKWMRSQPRVSELPQPLADFLATGPLDYAPHKRLPEALGPVELRAASDYICSLSDYEALIRSRWFTGSDLPTFDQAW